MAESVNTRKKLKLIVKNACRAFPTTAYIDSREYWANKKYEWLKKHRLALAGRESFVQEKLAPMGLIGTLASLIAALRMQKAKGRHFARIGKAARKQNKLVDVLKIAEAVEFNTSLRDIKFNCTK